MLSVRVAPPAAGSTPPPRVYSVAGCRLVADVACEPLAAFEVAGVRPASAPWQPAAPTRPARRSRRGGRTTFDGEGRIGGGLRRVTCRERDGGYRLRVDGVGTLAVGADGAIVAEGLEPGVEAGPVVEAVLGPALVLALAQRRIYCLHAAAVATGDRAVAFLGPSGAGKSTLAARLPELDGGWRRVADDVLPIAAEGGAFVALPHFPQLKLSRAEQAAGAADARLRLAALYVLEPPASAASAASAAAAAAAASAAPERVVVHRLSGRAAAVAVAGQTVAARLFAPDLLAAHLGFCTELAAQVPVRRIEYPRRLEALAEVAANLDNWTRLPSR